MSDWQQVKKELLKDAKFKKDITRVELELISSLIASRLEKGLTQAALARKIKTKQSAIARLESGNANPSIGFLQKLAEALGKRLVIKFE